MLNYLERRNPSDMMNQPSEIETEVVVVGYGGAGAAAAITAHDSGAQVLILEKMSEGGGNTRLSVGNFQSPRGLKAADHAEALCCGTTGRDILQTYAEGAMRNREWIEGLGKKGPLYPHMSGVNRGYHWSLDNPAEIDKGWLKRGKNIKELARQINVDEATLESTLNRYNEYCKQGQDPEFGRSRETLEPMDRPPFYAIEIRPGPLNTHGGPRRDKEARVISTEGKPIPRLYAAGELGSIWGRFPEGSGNNAESFVFGRIAGKNAAAEILW
ncbi:MAG: FAD-binding protein [Chloroflexota bacterium]